MYDPNDLILRHQYGLVPNGYDLYGTSQVRPSPVAIIAQHNPEMAVALARILGLVKVRHEATLGAIAQARDGMMNAGAIALAAVHRDGLGERGIRMRAHGYATVAGTSYRRWFTTYGPERSEAGFEVTIERL